jgi:hypothetical protein
MPESHKKDPAIANLLSSGLFNTTHIDEQIRKEREAREKLTNELKAAHEQGEDIAEYVWPREWDLRKRPSPHHASNIISLADAVHLCGQHFHGVLWNEKDWYARSPEEMEQWKPEHNFHRAWNFTQNKKGADFTNRLEEENQAFTRKKEIYSKLSSWLNQKAVEAFTLDNQGNKTAIPINTWLSSHALDILDEGIIHERGEDGHLIISGKSDFVYLNKEQLGKALNKAKLPSETKNREELKPKGITCPDGIWSIQAILLFSDKEKGEDGQNRKMGEISQSFIHFLITAPALEVFTINSYSGNKQPIDRDYLRSKRAITDFIRGLIPFGDFHANEDDGEYIFVNKDQFERVLADKPLTESSVSDEGTEMLDSYTPAYLELMFKAVKALNLSPDKRANMDAVMTWLKKIGPLIWKVNQTG